MARPSGCTTTAACRPTIRSSTAPRPAGYLELGTSQRAGLVIHPDTGDVWVNEHGPQGGDELNLLLPGELRVTVIGFGVTTGPGSRFTGTHDETIEQPTQMWVPSIGISGLMVYTGDRFPQWRGSLFAGGMVGKSWHG